MIVGRNREFSDLEGLVIRAGVGVLVRGGHGVGKSALTDEFVAGAGDGFVVGRAVATRAAQEIPFGALASLLPELPSGPVNRVQLLGLAVRAVRSRADGARLLLWVDDADLLDDASAVVVDQLVRSGEVIVVATQASDCPVPEWLVGLIKVGLVHEYELGPLDRSGLVELVSHAVDDGVVEPAVVNELWRLSEGNPLIASELVATARRTGALVERADVWCADGPFVASVLLGEVIDARLVGRDRNQMAVLETAAIGGVVGLAILEAVGGRTVVETLEADGLIRVYSDAARVLVTVGHPLMSDRIVQSMPVTRRRRVDRTLAEWLVSTGARRAGDALRVAAWELDGGVPVRPEFAVRAAKQALGGSDPGLARRLCSAALGAGAGFQAQLTLGQALAALGEVADAGEALIRAQQVAGDDAELACATVARCEMLALQCHDLESALDVATEAVAAIADPDWADEVHAELARLALAVGRPEEALRIGSGITARVDPSPRALTVGLVVSASAHVMLGGFAMAAADARRGLALVDTLAADGPPQASQRLWSALIGALVYSGELGEAAAIADNQLGSAVDASDTAMVGVWRATSAFIASWSGDVDASRRLYEESIASLTLHDPFAVLSRVWARAALAAAYAGDQTAVEQALAGVDHRYVESRVRTKIVGNRAMAWSLALAGDTEAAANEALKSGLIARDHQHFTMAGVALHEAVRFGHPTIVSNELDALAPKFDGNLLPILARHASAAAESDGDALDAIAADFADVGANLLAAEAASHAAAAYQRGNNDRAAFRSRSRCEALLTRCPGAETLAITQSHPLLTARQDQIARLAVGHTNREIATMLAISVRTVETHIAAVFQKLGIHHRAELDTDTGTGHDT